jgi:biopolymer transport protein ExbD
MKLSIKATKPPRIEMMPLIDVVFLLLIFFIFAMLSMSVHRGRQVDLPVSGIAVQKQATPVAMTLQEQNSSTIFFIGKEQIPAAGLIVALKDELQRQRMAGQQESIQLFADKSLPYQEVYSALDKINQAGFHQVLLQAQPGRRTMPQ